MQRRTPRRTATTLLVAILAATMVVPYPALGCCATAKTDDCCCKAAKSAADDAASCCPSTNAKTPAAAAASDVCVTGTCACCQPVAPQNIPPDRSTERIQPDHSVAFMTIAWSPASVGARVPLLAVPAADLVAIPHRILHCSWLI